VCLFPKNIFPCLFPINNFRKIGHCKTFYSQPSNLIYLLKNILNSWSPVKYFINNNSFTISFYYSNHHCYLTTTTITIFSYTFIISPPPSLLFFFQAIKHFIKKQFTRNLIRKMFYMKQMDPLLTSSTYFFLSSFIYYNIDLQMLIL